MRQKTDKRISLTPRDFLLFEFLHRHGGRLPTTYLFNYLKDTYTCFQRLQHRLRDLYNEAKLLDRDWKQQETIDPRFNEIVHELNEHSINLLKERERYHEYAPSMSGSYKHQVMLSCISASFELQAKESYIPQHTILERAGHDHVMTVNGDKVAPDEVFGLKIDGKELLIFLEVDRGTEATVSENFNRKSWSRSIKQYKEIIGHGQYKEHFNTKNGALLLIVTVSKAKQEGILSVIKEEYPQGCPFILVHYIKEFSRAFHPPKEIDILGVDWLRSGYPIWRFKK